MNMKLIVQIKVRSANEGRLKIVTAPGIIK